MGLGLAFMELDQLLSKHEKMTAEESIFMSSCISKAGKDFNIGAAVGTGLVWAATWKLSRFTRVFTTIGASTVCGLWTSLKSLDSSEDQILGLDGTRMQTELANIIVQKYRNDAVKMKLVSKYFYTEEVFDASTTNRPILRLRHRNFFSENLSLSGRESDSDDYGNYSDQPPHDKLDPSSNVRQHESSRVPSLKNSGVLKETRSEVKKFHSGILPDILEDPLGFMFDSSTATGDIDHQTASSSTNRSSRRYSRRSHRRRPSRHRELEDVALA